MSELKPCPALADDVAKLLRLVSDAPCDLCAGECRKHSLAEKWVPEEGSRAWAENVLRRLMATSPQPTASVDAEQVWREALEEAAKACETYTYGSGRPVDNGEYFSALIRSLKGGQQ